MTFEYITRLTSTSLERIETVHDRKHPPAAGELSSAQTNILPRHSSTTHKPAVKFSDTRGVRDPARVRRQGK